MVPKMSWKRALLAILLLGLLPGFSSAQRFAEGVKGMVVAPTPEAADAGLAILKRGGNAVDAAAAAAFAIMVTDPGMSSLGGRAQILVRLADGTVAGIDGATQVPSMARSPAKTGRGYCTCPVPGGPLAIQQMVQRYGTLPLRVLLQPAIRLAREGFVIKQDYHEFFRRAGKVFRLYPGTAAHFLKPDGSFYSRGDVFRQPALAHTLEVIAERGAEALYRGELAEAILRDMREHGGLIREEDLARYRPLPGEIVRGTYRGFEVIGRGDQCNGAAVIEALQILEQYPLSRFWSENPLRFFHVQSQAVYLAMVDTYIADWLQASPALARRRAREIDLEKALPVPRRPVSAEEASWTTHLSVVDAQGNAVALTQSLGPVFGSKVANPELGFFYAYSYRMNDSVAPLSRDKTNQSPTLVLHKGDPFLVLGAAGGAHIPSAIIATILNVVDLQMPLADAVSAPRVYLSDRGLEVETAGMSPELLSGLEKLGYTLRPYSGRNPRFGKVQAVLVDTLSGKRLGASDPRDYGKAAGY